MLDHKLFHSLTADELSTARYITAKSIKVYRKTLRSVQPAGGEYLRGVVAGMRHMASYLNSCRQSRRKIFHARKAWKLRKAL